MSKQRVQKSPIPPPEVKGQDPGSFRPEFRHVTEEDISFALRVLTTDYGKRLAILTQQEIQVLTAKGKSTVSTWVNEGTLPAVCFITIAQEAARLGDFALIELLIPKNYSLAPHPGGVTNGDCSDEECALVGAADRARIAFEKGDSRTFRQELSEVKKQVALLEAEGRAM